MDSTPPLHASGGGASGGARPQIRNVVQINPAADALGFAAASMAGNARLVRITELGTARLMAQILPPAGADMKIWLPDRMLLAHGPETVAPVLDNLRPCRLAILHRISSKSRVATLLDHLRPDAICVAPEVPPAWTPGDGRAAPGSGMSGSGMSDLAVLDPGFDLSGCGLAGVRLFADDAGAEALVTALMTLDGARWRRLRAREHVYDVEDFVPCSGIYPNERDAWGRWAWTGPETIATFLAPMHGGERVRLTLFFFANKRPLDAENIRVLVNGRSFVSRYFPEEMKIEIAVEGLGDASFARFDLLQSVMVPTEDQSRRLGFALHKLKIEVEP